MTADSGTVSYDTELKRHDAVLREAADVQRDDRVLDVGCGSGQTTRQAARTARDGSVLGVDVSARAIKAARARARAEGLDNVTFEHADAQVHRFAPERFDRAISRFGTMFFADPVAAFVNVGRALCPGGRLVMMVWQARERNEWAVAVRRALEAADGPGTGASARPDAFSLADPTTVSRTLQAAGFTGAAFTEVREPVHYGPDVTAALDWVRSFTASADVPTGRDPAVAAVAEERLRRVLEAHLDDDGVWFDSRAWIITARRSD